MPARIQAYREDYVLEGNGIKEMQKSRVFAHDHFAVRRPLMPFSSVAFEPCPIGLLEVEGGLRVMGWIPKVDLKKIKVGTKMRAHPQILPDGRITIVLEPT